MPTKRTTTIVRSRRFKNRKKPTARKASMPAWAQSLRDVFVEVFHEAMHVQNQRLARIEQSLLKLATPTPLSPVLREDKTPAVVPGKLSDGSIPVMGQVVVVPNGDAMPLKLARVEVWAQSYHFGAGGPADPDVQHPLDQCRPLTDIEMGTYAREIEALHNA